MLVELIFVVEPIEIFVAMFPPPVPINKLLIEWGVKKYREGEVFKESYLHDLLPNWQPSVQLNEGLRKTFSEFL